MGTKAKMLSLFVVCTILVGLPLLSVSQNDEGKYRLLVQRFEQDTLESKQEVSLEITTSLKSSFTRFDELVIQDAGSYPQLSWNDLQDKAKMDSLSDVDAVVFGSYIVTDKYLKIDPVIYELETGLYYRLNYSRGTVKGMDVLVDEVADNLFETLVEISSELQGNAQRIVIDSDFDMVSGDYKNAGPVRRKADDYTRQVIQNLDYLAPANANFVSWSELQEFSDFDGAEKISKTSADLYMVLQFVFNKGEIEVLKTNINILVKSRDRLQKMDFELPELKASHYPDYDFVEYVTNELYNFLERAIDENGQWNMSAFPNKTATKSDNAEGVIYKAQNAFARNDFYLSNYYYYDALNRFADEEQAADLRLQIGFNKIYMDRLEEAELEFDYVLSSKKDDGYAYLGKSIINYYDGSYEAAIENLNKAKESGLDNAFIFHALEGYYRFELSQYEEALAAFNTALATDRGKLKIQVANYFSEAFIKVHVGLSMVALKRYDEAITYYKDLIKEFPYNKEIPYYLGDAYTKKGISEYFDENYAQALADFMLSRETYVNPKINDYIRTAYMYEKKYAEAEAFIRNEIETGGYDEYFIWSLHATNLRSYLLIQYEEAGLVSFDEDLGREAIRIYEINLEKIPDDPLSYYHIGEIYMILGDNSRGLEYMQKAFEMDNMDFDIQTGLLQGYLLNNDFDAFDRLSKSLSKLNRKFVVPDRTRALVDYLNISAAYVQDKKAKKEEKNLKKLMDAEVVIDNWIYAPYLSWVENCACDQSVKDELVKLTDSMKSRSLN